MSMHSEDGPFKQLAQTSAVLGALLRGAVAACTYETTTTTHQLDRCKVVEAAIHSQELHPPPHTVIAIGCMLVLHINGPYYFDAPCHQLRNGYTEHRPIIISRNVGTKRITPPQ
jgi:hypothetical protein